MTAVPLLVVAVRPRVTPRTVLVAPDLGAAKLAQRYGKLLGRPVAVVEKARLSGESVSVQGVLGQVQGIVPLIVDDMISTAGTVEAAALALLEVGCAPPIGVAASHALLVGPAVARLENLPLSYLVASNSVAVAPDLPLPIQSVSLAPLLAEAIAALHSNRSLQHLLAHV